MAASLNPTASALLPAAPADGQARASIRRHLALSLGLSIALVAGVGGWAATTQIAGAVIAPGQMVVESNVKKVQHPTGGVVGELRVREGDRVHLGDVLIRLDDTQTRANLEIVLRALDELSARRARDEAERDGATRVRFPDDLVARASDPAVTRLMSGEETLFAARVASREGQKAQLRERIAQLRQEIAGLTEQAAAKEREIALIGTELVGVRELFAKNLVPVGRVTVLERDAARLQGERGQLVAATASARGKITETELQILQVDGDMRTEVGKELAEIRGRWSELVEKRVAAEDQLKRVDLRAPQDGVVHQLAVHTVGGLVTPAEPAMLIVPTSDQLAVEVRVQPQDIDSVSRGQHALLRFPAFNQRTTPEIDGSVERVSADVTTDPKTGASHYTLRILVPQSEKDRLGGARLVPGMPVEAFLQIGERSVLSYLVKPLSDQIAKAWREK
ncbi:HlyD family type I secretion periplasmic adaptor subunit [Methylobacterium sp. SyP6R]|uniref:HlyD family type I secretion periplasmic adaptor subunit n=1 Tax=Methylobacterium sp. SyP6R TaxID=2718876 RepID=UPI001EFF971B|nr:HlyD family type I secretion periplasmic adaptor subunit [Methylobacterium sp. SyP6R]MCF4130156.1 HlyD family type I secretion periplasmic adaptor subunit [Methylobacterium sp. SyP6R]